MTQHIRNPSDYTSDSTAWNPPSDLAPVGSDMMIKLTAGSVVHHPEWPDAAVMKEDSIVQAVRTSYISDKNRAMKYELLDGSYVHGRFDWTHA